MTTISNKFLTVTAKTKGAELDSIFHNELKQEYLWNADASYWGKKSPVLFPIVGALKNNAYHFDENEYQLNRHGFARDMDFELESNTDKEMTFLLESNPETKKLFPFDFEFRVTYSLQRNALHVAYDVKNMGAEEMFFSQALLLPRRPGPTVDRRGRAKGDPAGLGLSGETIGLKTLMNADAVAAAIHGSITVKPRRCRNSAALNVATAQRRCMAVAATIRSCGPISGRPPSVAPKVAHGPWRPRRPRARVRAGGTSSPASGFGVWRGRHQIRPPTRTAVRKV